MGDKLVKLLIFAAGAALGSIATWALVKDKYERIAQEEIDSVKEYFRKAKEPIETDDENDDISNEVNRDVVDYSKLAVNLGYSDKQEKGGEDMTDRPYVISPEEFGEYEDYGAVSLTYYADKVLADEDDEIVDDIDYIIGEDSLNHFGEYEDDSVFVRNDRLECDYEILLDERNYYDIVHDDTPMVSDQ